MNLGRWVVLLAAAGSLLSVPSPASPTARPNASDRRLRLGRIQVPFTENCGQFEESVAFSARTFFGAAFVTRDGRLVYSLAPARTPAGAAAPTGWSLTETLIGANPSVTAGQPAAARVSVFAGVDPARWQSAIPTYEDVRLGQAWPGVSVSVRAHGENVEKLFTLAPGARPERIRLRLEGAKSLRIDRDGNLVAETGGGDVRFTRPVAYQEIDGSRHPVEVAYGLQGSRYGFRLGRHDPSLPVVIDPLLQSTYLGGSELDGVSAIAVHPTTGEIYVAGGTSSVDFPKASGGIKSALTGINDFFLARFDASLTTLIQATFLGGSGQEGIGALAFDPGTGDVLAGGFTLSTDFPGTANGAQTFNAGGGEDGWVARLNRELTTLIGATYVGDSGEDFVNAIGVDPATGDVLAAGQTFSATLPGSTGGAQPAFGGGQYDGFVTRLDTTLTSFLKTTFLGGTDAERVDALAVDPATGDVLVVGFTASADFPFTAGGAEPDSPGGAHGFAARIDPTLTVVQATYLGGFANPSNQDSFTEADAVAISAATGEVVVAGATSTRFLPDTSGGAQPSYGGGDEDGFVARLDSGLTRVLQATYIGGSGLDFLYAMTVAPNGDVFVAGQTASLDLPGTAGGLQPTNVLGDLNAAYPSDAFVVRLDPTLTHVRQATYLGGDGDDQARAIAVHPSTGEILVAGDTTSDDFPGTAGGAQPAYAGGGGQFPFEGWVARLSPDLRKDVCASDSETLCLEGGRFRVTVEWSVPSRGRSGEGMAVPLTGDTGAFWFFEPSNLELVVKVLDGRPINGHFWVFAGALSNVDYSITVTDTDTHDVKTYTHGGGTLASIADTSAFPPSGDDETASAVSPAVVGSTGGGPYALDEAATGAPAPLAQPDEMPCTAGSATLCLLQGRFQVTVDWDVPDQGRFGHATAVPLGGGESGYFWFLSPDNVELVVKLLDGRQINGHFWLFYGSLSTVHYTVRVTDTQTGLTQSYENPNHTLASKADTSAF